MVIAWRAEDIKTKQPEVNQCVINKATISENKHFYFHRVALTFEFVDKIPWCDHSNVTLLTVPSRGAINLFFSSLLNEILKACLWLTLKREMFPALRI